MKGSILKTSKSRIDTIDVLRGFALAGILYAHMVLWYTGASLPPEVYLQYESTPDAIAFAVFGALVFGKFFSVFSFLFGLGFYLHIRKKSSRPGYLKVYVWRLFLLFVIGLIHHTLWRGDILTIYAVLGMILLLFRKLPVKLILTLAILFIFNVPTHLYDLLNPEIGETGVEFPMPGEAERYYALVKNEGFLTVLQENWSSWSAKIRYQLESGRFVMTFGYFLLGLYAGRTGLFRSIDRNLSKFRNWNKISERAVLILLLFGLLMYLFDLVSLPEIEVVPQLQWTSGFLFSVYNAFLTIFYITGITLLFRKRFFQRLLLPLAAMGRMALTNYLLQTVFGLALFYHFGLGLLEISSPATNVLLGVVVFYLQLKMSRWWLKRFNQGPAEWLWKGLTNFHFPAIRKKKHRIQKPEVVETPTN